MDGAGYAAQATPSRRVMAVLAVFAGGSQISASRKLIILLAVDIAPRMSWRWFFAIWIAVAMSFAPLAMRQGAAMAAPQPSHHGAMIDWADHCHGKSDSGKPGKPVEKSCCAAMCVGMTMAPASTEQPLAHRAMSQRSGLDRFERGFLAELPTPPPRKA